MNRHAFEFDSLSLGLMKVRNRAWCIIKWVLLWLFGSFALAVVGYVLFSAVFSTDVERKLRRENRMYEKVYPSLLAKGGILNDVIANIQYKDNEIYEQVFHSSAPSVDPMSSLDFLFASDTIPDTRLASYVRDKSDNLIVRASAVEENFRKIYLSIADSSFVSPPMSLPLKGITYPQVSASCGRKMNPFLKAYVVHTGVDLIVNRGTPVYAPADGVVSDETRTYKSQGIFVEIRHDGGYVTRYAHLESRNVTPGQRVRRGQKIGTVGMSGNAFAPHLHYEVLRDGKHVDPVNYFFASVGPTDYANMLYMGANTLQSMD